VQLANFEFFSGVFREFTVSVAKTYVAANAEVDCRRDVRREKRA
jgi:hypothetical protein